MPTILICDDEEILRKLVRATLTAKAYELVEAADGDAALERARSVQPDVILLDMMMPGRSGLDVLRALRADAATSSIPVVMLTARALPTDVAAAESAGANHFLPKPFSPVVLASLVDSILDEQS